MSTLAEIAAQLQSIAAALAEMEAPPVDEDSVAKPISEIFPGFTEAGTGRRPLKGSATMTEGQIIRSAFTVADDAGAFSFSLGTQGSNLGVTMLLENGFRLRLTRPDGSPVTEWGPRAGVTAEPVKRRLPAFLGNWARPGAQGAGRPQVNRGERLVLEIIAGRPTVEGPEQLLKLHYIPTI